MGRMSRKDMYIRNGVLGGIARGVLIIFVSAHTVLDISL